MKVQSLLPSFIRWLSDLKIYQQKNVKYLTFLVHNFDYNFDSKLKKCNFLDLVAKANIALSNAKLCMRNAINR